MKLTTFCIFRGLPVFLGSLLLAASPLAAADEQHIDERELRYEGVSEVQLLNLVGEIRLEAGSGNAVELVARVTAVGDDAAEARANAALVELDAEQHGNTLRLLTRYPVDDHDRYVYDPGRGGHFSGSTSYQGERVEIRSSGSGLRLHVDFVLKLPAGTDAMVINKVGKVIAANIEGDLDLDTSSGSIEVVGGKGDTVADTGSGRVDIRDREGDVYADTGSGQVQVENVVGEVEADTGSGGVSLRNITGDILVDTGSGRAELDGISGNIRIDTGSGGVEARRLEQVRELEVDTGSGSVELDGDFSQLEDMVIDTGSGGVRIVTTGTLNMELEIDTGSGGSRVELPGMSNVRTGRGEFSATIGNGKGRGVIDTGSGSVRISSR